MLNSISLCQADSSVLLSYLDLLIIIPQHMQVCSLPSLHKAPLREEGVFILRDCGMIQETYRLRAVPKHLKTKYTCVMKYIFQTLMFVTLYRTQDISNRNY